MMTRRCAFGTRDLAATFAGATLPGSSLTTGSVVEATAPGAAPGGGSGGDSTTGARAISPMGFGAGLHQRQQRVARRFRIEVEHEAMAYSPAGASGNT